MTDKSYVTLEQKQCLVCGKVYDTGNLLMDRRLKASFDRHTVTGGGLCPEDEKLRKGGYIALVECDPSRSTVKGDLVKPHEAYHTGKVCHVRATAWEEFFEVPVPESPLVYVEPGVIDKLKSLQEAADAAREGKKA